MSGMSASDVVEMWTHTERLLASAETVTLTGPVAARIIRPAGGGEPEWQLAEGESADETADDGAGETAGEGTDEPAAGAKFRSLKLPAPPRTMALAASGACACVWAKPGDEFGGLAVVDTSGLTIFMRADVRPSSLVAAADSSFFAALSADGVVLLRPTDAGWSVAVEPVEMEIGLGSSVLLTDGTPGASGVVLVTGRGSVASWSSPDGVTWTPTQANVVDAAQQVQATSVGLLSWPAQASAVTLWTWAGDVVEIPLPPEMEPNSIRAATAGRLMQGCQLQLRCVSDGRERHLATQVLLGPFDEPHWSQTARHASTPAADTDDVSRWQTVWQGEVGERAHQWGVGRSVISQTPRSPAATRAELPCDFPALTTWTSEVPTTDGVAIPLQLAGDPDRLHGPVVMTVYGGFGVVNDLEAGPTAAAWASYGGWTVAAGVRGGGERGKPWHRAGSGPNKLTSVADCVTVVRALADRGHRVVLLGASHGGWLAAMTALRCPEALAGVVLTSPLLDLRAPERHGYGRLWLQEFGLDAHPDASWRHDISPLAQLQDRADGELPPMLLFTPEADARVNPADAQEWASACARCGGEVTVWTLPAGHANAGLAAANARLLETLSAAARWCGVSED